MTRWQPLPATLPREARHLVEQLRLLKGRTGLSLAGLARRTAYSKSSWQRYLSGDRLPPRGAAQMLCRLAGGDQARLLALWELAEQAWPQGASEPAAETVPRLSGTAGPAEPAKPSTGQRRWRIAALAASALAVLLAAGLLWALPRRAGGPAAARPRAVLSPAARSTRSSRNPCP
ncbi:helix-turn-helix transcriptional regulator [Streptomyces sp. GbtcB6]|uniref:helix-turn-helix domain-containing protein n=1 Tax=Streptomyces sp. GbtcB6 TaxID=2824751 RepID=UPI001C3109DA|nr:helix-turn-helix transcriptional regulator [Streptomyces sp. GbtcB6]